MLKKLYFLIFICCLTTLIGGCASQPFSQSGAKSEMFYVKTDDNWKLAVRRFNGGSGKPPVILCHGLNYNERFYTLSLSANLPEYLALSGYDVWVVSLRGSGSSTKWVYKLAERAMEGYDVYNMVDAEDWVGVGLTGISLLYKLANDQYTNLTINPLYSNWVLDDYSFHDVPAVVKFVKEKTNSDSVFWVGHSMGGIIMLSYLIKHPEANHDIKAMVTVGSQLTMTPGNNVIDEYIRQLQFLRLLELAGKDIEIEQARKIARETSDDLFFYPPNRDPSISNSLNSVGMDTPSVGVLGQYLEIIASGELKTYDNSFNFAKNADKITVPYLIMGGNKDALAPPPVQQFLYDNISSEDKKKLILGTGYGFSVDFGHNDSIISPAARQEVYPIIKEWLDNHSGTDI